MVAKHVSKNIPAKPEPDSEGEPDPGEIDDSILDLNSEDQPTGTTRYISPTGVSAPAGLSSLQPASSSGGLQFVQPSIPPPRSAAFHTVLVSTTSAVFFKMPVPLKPSASQDLLFSSAPDLQRLIPPPTPEYANDGEFVSTESETNTGTFFTITVGSSRVSGLLHVTNF